MRKNKYLIRRGGITGFEVGQLAEETGEYYVGRGFYTAFQKGDFVPRRPFWSISQCYLPLTFTQKIALFFGRSVYTTSEKDMLKGHRPADPKFSYAR